MLCTFANGGVRKSCNFCQSLKPKNGLINGPQIGAKKLNKSNFPVFLFHLVLDI